MVDNRQRSARRAGTAVAACCVVVLSGLVSAGDATAATTPPTFGPQVDVGPGFFQPQGVAVNTAGDVYVADPATNTVSRVPADGGPTTSVGSGYQQPMAVAVDGDGTVYVADYNNARIERIDADGTQSTAVSGLSAPSGLALDSAGNLFIANTGGHDILEWDAGSGAVSTIARNIVLPTGVAVDASGAVYAVDASTSGNSVTKYVAGQPSEVLPIPGLQNPNAAAFDAQGNLFVANQGLNNVLMVTPSGSTTTVGSGYVSPMGVAVNAAGDVLVADTMNHRVTLNPSVDPQSITLVAPLPPQRAPGSSSALTATGGASGNPVVFSIDPTTYPSNACAFVAGGTRMRYNTIGTCVISIDQAGSFRYLPAHRTLSVTIRPDGLDSVQVQAPSTPPAVGADVPLTARGRDAQGNDLGDVTAITAFSLGGNGSCHRNSCTWSTAGASTVRATAPRARGSAVSVTATLGVALVSGNTPVTSFTATVGSPIDATIHAAGGSSGTYVSARTSGRFPPGVSLASDGTFSGTPTRTGTFPLTVTVRDASNPGQRAVVTTDILVTAATPPST